MKFKRIISVILIVGLIFTLTGCKAGKASTEKVAKTLMKALQTYDINTISDCIEDFPGSTGTELIHNIYTEDYYRDLYSVANKNLKYKITSVTAEEITVKVDMPDLYQLYQTKVEELLGSAESNEETLNLLLNGTNDAGHEAHIAVIAEMTNDIEANGISTTSTTIKLSVLQINGNVKVKADNQLAILLSDGLFNALTTISDTSSK